MRTVEMYVADDGRVFNTESECCHYERYEMIVNPETNEPVRLVGIGESLV